MGTKCKFVKGNQIFSGNAQYISAGGNVTSNQQVVSSTSEVVVLTDTIYADTLNSTSMGFRVLIVGEISSSGSGDITLTLRYGTTDILALTTSAAPNEDDKTFKFEWTGHVLTTGSSGKIVAHVEGTIAWGTQVWYLLDTVAGGASVDLTVDGSLNVTAHWDNSSTDDDIIVTHGWVQYFN